MMMILQMLGVGRKQTQVLKSVIQPIAVDMMDNLMPSQFTAKIFFHYKPMLQWSFSSSGKHHSIARIIDRARAKWRILSNQWITIPSPHCIMIIAVAASPTLFYTTFDGTKFHTTL
jgi:hypothetical protein